MSSRCRNSAGALLSVRGVVCSCALRAREARIPRRAAAAKAAPHADAAERRCSRPVPRRRPAIRAARDYENNAFHISRGQRLFRWFNCNGCHANGGGGMGPALMDDEWRYGGSIEQIYATIIEGRPNGMPSFRGKITDAADLGARRLRAGAVGQRAERCRAEPARRP